MQMTSLVTFTSIRAIFGGKSLVFWWQKLSSVQDGEELLRYWLRESLD
jgi:hypothetical protein